MTDGRYWGRPLRATVHLQIQADSAFSLWLKAAFRHLRLYSPNREAKQTSPLICVNEVPEETRSGLCDQKGADGMQAQQVTSYVAACLSYRLELGLWLRDC